MLIAGMRIRAAWARAGLAFIPLLAALAACSAALSHHWSIYYPVIVEVEFDGERVKWDFDAECRYRSKEDPSKTLSETQLLRTATFEGRRLRTGGALFIAVPNMCDRPFSLLSDYWDTGNLRSPKWVVAHRDLSAPPNHVPFVWWYDRLPRWSKTEAYVTGKAYLPGSRIKLLSVHIGPMAFEPRAGSQALDHLKREADPKEPTQNFRTVWLDVDSVVTRRAAQYGVIGRENGNVEPRPGCGVGLMAMRIPHEAIEQQPKIAAYAKSIRDEATVVPDADRFDWYPRAGQTKVAGIALGAFSLQNGWLAGQGTVLNPAQGYGILPIIRSSEGGRFNQRASSIGMVSDRRMGPAGGDPTSIGAASLPMLDGLVAVECDHEKCEPQFDRPGVVLARYSETCTPANNVTLNWRGKKFEVYGDEHGERQSTQIVDPKDGSVWTFSNVRQGGVDPE